MNIYMNLIINNKKKLSELKFNNNNIYNIYNIYYMNYIINIIQLI